MLWLVPLFPLAGAALIHLGGRRWGRRAWTLAALALALVTAGLTGAAIAGEWEGALRWGEGLTLRLGVAPLAAVFALVIPLVGLPVLAFAGLHEEERGLGRLLALLLAFMGAMELLVLAADLLTLLIAWEAVGACSWALIAHDWRREKHARDAARAFLVTRLGDLGLFVAVFAAHAGLGTLDYQALGELSGPLLQVFAAGIVLAAAAKSAQLPFSPWLFSAMSGPAPVSALLHAATMVAAGVFILIRLHGPLSELAWFKPVVMGLGLATALAGGVVASTQGHAKKLLAASTSAHYGLMWTAVGAGYPGVAALHFVAHAAMKGALFLLAGAAGRAAGSYQLRDMGLSGRLPGLALASLAASLALAGLFPLGAGWSKEKVVGAAGHVSPWLAVLVMLAGAMSALYAMRFHLLAFGAGQATPGHAGPDRPGGREHGGIYLLALLCLALGVFWLPSASHRLALLLGVEFPPYKLWELLLSTLLIVAGGAAGCWLARRKGEQGRAAAWAAAWYRLGAMGHWLLWRPVAAGSAALARLDDAWDERLCAAAGGVHDRLADRLARGSDTALDRGLMHGARRVRGFALYLSRAGEAAAERLPGWPARLSGQGGILVQRLQTGLSHHYYSLAAVGAALAILMLILGVVSL